MDWLNLIKRAASVLAGPAAPPSNSRHQPVGSGHDNEVQVTIDGLPHLFRDEGTHIVHFVAQFDKRLVRTPFGDKLLPDVVPRWHMHQKFHGKQLEDAVSDVIRVSEASPSAPPGIKRDARGSTGASAPAAVSDVREAEGTAGPRDRPVQRHSSSAVEVGRLTFWGELEFPSRKKRDSRAPETYTSFAVKLDTPAGEKVLQGEGLKDAISEARCQLGDKVAVRRLHKVKVPAFDHKSGRPIHDRATGEQKQWDKWVWQIDLIH